MAVKKIETLNKHQNPATNENEFDIENYMNVNWDKIKEVVDNNADELTTTQGKVTTLETDNTKNKQDISGIKENQELQNDLLQRTKDALINITTEKSDNIHVEDSSNLTAKIDVYGTSSQKTREGYNLLNVASTYEVAGSKTVAIKMPTGTYTIKADDVVTDSEQTQFCFSFRDSSGTIADARISLSTKKITFALTREATSVVIYSGNSFNESQGVTTTYKNLMIYEGTDDKEYEEYGKTPSPEISSEIENVTGDIDITVCNKNFLNVNSECKVAGSKTVAIKMPTGTYTIKADDVVTDSEQTQFCFSFRDSSGTIADARISLSTKKITFALTREATSVVIYSGNSFNESQGVTTTYKNLMIYKETDDEQYTEHEQQLITFPLAEGQRLMKDDYLADDGIHHVRKQFVVNGTENIYRVELLSTGYIRFNLSKKGCTGTYGGATTIRFCNIFKSEELKRWDILTSNENVIGIASYTDQLKIVIENIFGITEADNLDTMKSKVSSWLQNNNIVVEEVVDEYVEEYTEEQQEAYNKLQNVLSYKTVTNIFTDKAILEFKYVADTETWVVNEIKPLKEQLTTINELLSTTGTSALLLDNMQTDLESEVI